jgi:hypothetical protein
MTADGNELGAVKETMGGCFKIDAPMQPDYWLGIDTIADGTGGVVRLNITKDSLSEAKMDSPEHKGYHHHM